MMRSVLLAASCLAAWTPALAGQNARLKARGSPEVRRLDLPGATHVDLQDLEMSIYTQASSCRSLFIWPFCLISRSPAFWDKHYLDDKEIPRDVIRIRLYYWKRGYRDADVDTSIVQTEPGQVRVTFTVHENRPTLIRKLSVTYDTTLITAKIRNRLTLVHVNDPLDLVLLDSTRVMFQNQLWDLGYGDAVVDTSVVVDEAAHRADVALRLTPNRRTTIGRITVTGAQRISERTIRNSLTFATGDLYRQSEVEDSQRNLYESNLFRLVGIDVPPQYDSVKNVNIDVVEAHLHEVRAGPGFDNIEFLQLQAHYTAYNLFGGARRLDVDGTVGNLLARPLHGHGIFRSVTADVPDSALGPFLEPTYTASVDLKQPDFLRRPADAAAVGAFAHRNINPGVYVDQGFGTQATLTHDVAARAPISLNYRYELNRVQASDTYFCVNYGVCDTATINTLRSHQSLSPLTLTGFIDRSDGPFEPTKGYIARLDLEHASSWTGSNYAYDRAFFDGSIYSHASGTKRILAAHVRVGWVRAISGGTDPGILHPRKRFYAGGANSVRGFDEGQLGPRVLTIDDTTLVRNATSIGGGTCGFGINAVKFCDPNSPALSQGDFLPQPLGGTSLLEGSVEYRVPLARTGTFRNYTAAVFIDGGVVGSADIRGVHTIGSFVNGTGAITPGVGGRYQSSFGPIRVDIGYNPKGPQKLVVVTAVPDSTGKVVIVPLLQTRSFSPRTFFDRLALHFSIGEAF